MFIFSFKHYITAFKGTKGESKPEVSLTVSDLPGEESEYLPQQPSMREGVEIGCSLGVCQGLEGL